jgi:hypothetical protein
MDFWLKNVALYAKHHYVRSDDIIADLTKCLNADGYTPFGKHDICTIITNSCENIFMPKRLSNFIEDISPENCSRFGYYCKESRFIGYYDKREDLPSYDIIMATIHYMLSNLAHTEISKLGDIGKADPKVLPIKQKETA